MTRIVVLGGGPGGYEAALVAAQLGAQITVVDSDGIGGSCVLTDCVPSKTLIATAEAAWNAAESRRLGVKVRGAEDLGPSAFGVDLARVNTRVRALAQAQSTDIHDRLTIAGVRVLPGRGRLTSPTAVVAEGNDGTEEELPADAILVATGARPRVLADAMPDGERILTWTQVYGLTALPEHLIVVGSGVTGAEFASAYNFGTEVTLVSSRDRVLPGEDADAAAVLEAAFVRRRMNIRSQARAKKVTRDGDVVHVELSDGEVITGSHVLMAVGSVPNTEHIGLAEAGVRLNSGGFVEVDKVSRTSTRGIYAAGDCTGVLMLASVAAHQGRIAMQHILGDAVRPLNLRAVAANVFTEPEIATVGVSQNEIDRGEVAARTVMLPLATNARAKMQGLRDGFVKLFCLPGTGIIIGGVVVAPRASELIYAVSLAVDCQLSADQVAHAFTVYPSMTGSIGEAARLLHLPPG
ncbi:NAD(P)H-quinone dehydrogenase [Sporichthya sp.]|uniref:NAD(P)H-quinone dehydrogenase n=1 Tax=Sporichthya sp. TaxID=65475 RepID=UPI0017CD31BD|nr:NAD(P)H-quinone dehydrogenase [Sporichthya sp.]MBA3745696.1 NAD(P)H-quinone dehydrogenase [Sporichthya sp.]